MMGDLLGTLRVDLPDTSRGARRSWFQAHSFLYRETDHERDTVVVALEDRCRRPVVTHGPQNFRDYCGLAFGQVVLFEKFTDAAISVAVGDRPSCPQIVHADRPVGTGKTQDRQVLQNDALLYRFSLLVRAMVDCVNQGLFDSGMGKIPESFRLRVMWVLDDCFLQVVSNDKVGGLTKNRRLKSSKRSPSKPSGNHTTSICVARKNRWGSSLKNSSPTFLGKDVSNCLPTMFMCRHKVFVEPFPEQDRCLRHERVAP